MSRRLDKNGFLSDRPYGIHSRTLPLPIWARRGFSDSGKQAWSSLTRDLCREDSSNPFCVYVHIPFCARRCSFLRLLFFCVTNAEQKPAYRQILVGTNPRNRTLGAFESFEIPPRIHHTFWWRHAHVSRNETFSSSGGNPAKLLQYRLENRVGNRNHGI